MPLAGPGKSRNRTVNRTVHRMMRKGWYRRHLTGAGARTGGGTERARRTAVSGDGSRLLSAAAECELEIALQEARADLAAGRFVHESVDEHLKRLDAMAIGPDD